MELSSTTRARLTPYLRTFFAEKDLPEMLFEVTAPGGTVNTISNVCVIEHIATAPRHEQEKIGNVIRKIDFANGNVNHFLEHLAGALAFDLA